MSNHALKIKKVQKYTPFEFLNFLINETNFVHKKHCFKALKNKKKFNFYLNPRPSRSMKILLLERSC